MKSKADDDLEEKDEDEKVDEDPPVGTRLGMCREKLEALVSMASRWKEESAFRELSNSAMTHGWRNLRIIFSEINEIQLQCKGKLDFPRDAWQAGRRPSFANMHDV
uniref:Uncharacterized protein n=1 Tax=Fibrocapsa japonica TaxID=94617 RepID=A0A7S2USV3_9STRA